jgi:hypothetical protein
MIHLKLVDFFWYDVKLNICKVENNNNNNNNIEKDASMEKWMTLQPLSS